MSQAKVLYDKICASNTVERALRFTTVLAPHEMNFLIQGTIAEIDETTSDEPYHPATALVVEAGNTLSRVVLPPSVLGDRLALLCVGRPVEITGEGAGWSFNRRPYLVATDLKLTVEAH